MAPGTKKMAGLLSNPKVCLCSLNFTPVGLPSHPMTCQLKNRYRICYEKNTRLSCVACQLRTKTDLRLASLLILRCVDSHVTWPDRHTPTCAMWTSDMSCLAMFDTNRQVLHIQLMIVLFSSMLANI